MRDVIREIVYKEYKEKYSEKTNKRICALLNSGSNSFSLIIDIGSAVNRLRKEIENRPSYMDVFGLNQEEVIEIITYEFRSAIYDSRIVYDELLKKLWASPADGMIENENSDSIYSIVDEVSKSIYIISDEYNVKEKSLVVNMYVNRPHTIDVFFCIRKRNRKSVSKVNEFGEKTIRDYVYEFYFMVGDKVVKTDETHLLYFEILTKRPELPIIKEYGPSDYALLKDFVEERDKNNVVFEIFEGINDGIPLYKYMDLESALLCLEMKQGSGKKPNIRFVEPTSWDDQYEGRFYCAKYEHYDSDGNIVDVDPKDVPFLYACCFSSKQDNEAAWVLYSHKRTGMASRCVEFTLDGLKLKQQLVRNLRDCSIYVGLVQYMKKEDIDRIHKPFDNNNQPNENYGKYFRPFTKEFYLYLLLLKRLAFEHEKEVRIFIIPNNEIGKEKAMRGKDGEFPSDEDKKPHPLFVDIDWIEVIKEVRINNNMSNWSNYEISLLQNRLNELVEEKKIKEELDDDKYQELLSNVKLKDVNLYKDEALAEYPITIVTNQ